MNILHINKRKSCTGNLDAKKFDVTNYSIYKKIYRDIYHIFQQYIEKII